MGGAASWGFHYYLILLHNPSLQHHEIAKCQEKVCVSIVREQQQLKRAKEKASKG